MSSARRGTKEIGLSDASASELRDARQQTTLDEIAVTTSQGSEGLIHVWELRSGALLRTLKSGDVGVDANCSALAQTSQFSFLAASPAGRSGVSTWLLQREQAHSKSITAEKVSAVTLSSDGGLCCAGSVSGKIYVWLVASGALLKVLDAHFKRVSVLRFTDDDSLLVSGGDDSIVNLWKTSHFGLFSSPHPSGAAEQPVAPWRVLSSHSLPITGLFVCPGGVGARLLPCSGDHTCKLWDLASGRALASMGFPRALTCWAMALPETAVFVGGSDAEIRCVSLLQRPTESSLQFSSETGALSYRGHTRAITALALSVDGTLLVSASVDASVKVWDVSSRRILRSFDRHLSPVTNLHLLFRPPNISGIATDKATPLVPPIAPFQKQLAVMTP